jgi:hypothetical protein
MDQSIMNPGATPSKRARGHALIAEGHKLLAEAAAEDATPTTSRPRFYSATSLPPGAASWRGARETCAREGIVVVRAGRTAMIDAAAWDAWLASRTRRPRPRVAAATPSDADRLAAMGVRLVAGGRR